MFVLTLAAWLAVAGALADSPAFQEGLAAYQDLEFELALERFRAASAEEGRSDDERATLAVWESMCRAGVGDDEGAKAAARRALELRLDVVPPEIAPPKVRGFLDEQRAEVAALAEAAAAAAEPIAAEQAPAAQRAPAGEELPLLLIAGGTMAGLGVVGLGGAALFGALTAGSLASASDPEAFQIDASNALQAANAQVATAAVLGVAGIALAGAGAALIAFDRLEE